MLRVTVILSIWCMQILTCFLSLVFLESHINSKLLFLIEFEATCFYCFIPYELALFLNSLRKWSRWELWSIYLWFLFFGISCFLEFSKEGPWHPIRRCLMLWGLSSFKSETFVESDLISYLIILDDHHIDWCSWNMCTHLFWEQYHFLFVMIHA